MLKPFSQSPYFREQRVAARRLRMKRALDKMAGKEMVIPKGIICDWNVCILLTDNKQCACSTSHFLQMGLCELDVLWVNFQTQKCTSTE